MKKHISQMTDSEIETLSKAISRLLINVRGLRFGKHAVKRIIDRQIDGSRIFEAMKEYEIIEYNQKDFGEGTMDNRVLLRGRKLIDNSNFCVVLSLSTRKVITVYLNNAKDRHNTLNINNYNEDLKILI